MLRTYWRRGAQTTGRETGDASADLSMTFASLLEGSSIFSITDSLTVVIAQKIGNQRNFRCAKQGEEHRKRTYRTYDK